MTERINDLIFKELIKRGYSLRGNTRVWNIADSKLWYLTPKQAQAYLDLYDVKNYQTDFDTKKMTVSKEIELIEKNIDKILKTIGSGPINLVDLGCGDGRKAIIFLEKLKGREKVRYCPIDISGYYVDKAISNIALTDVEEVIKFKWNISDFENLENITPLLSKGEFQKNFFLLLGNTAGNFEFHELLYEIQSAMKPGDFLLIGNGLDNGFVNRDVVDHLKGSKPLYKFFVQIPLGLGLKESDVEWSIQFNNSRVEYIFILKNDVTTTFQDKKINLFKGDQMIVGYTYHYQKKEFKDFLELYFEKANLFPSQDNSYTLALCQT